MHAVRPNVPIAQDLTDPDADLDLTDLDTELLDLFLEESNDILDHSDGLLAQLRDQSEDRETIVNLQRDLHTLKGGARMAGINAVGELGHAMESLLEAVVEGRSDLGRDRRGRARTRLRPPARHGHPRRRAQGRSPCRPG